MNVGETQSSRANVGALLWCLFWGIASTAWCWTTAFALSPTYDEPFYFEAGLKNWHALNHRELLAQGTMPLPAEVQTLPLRLTEMVLGRSLENDIAEWLPIARLTTAIFWWLLLWAAYQLASIYGGRGAGCLAVALLACEPVLLGHASLATTDVPQTACLLALLAVFRSRRDEESWRKRLILPAVFVTLAYLAKATALVFVPVCLVLIELERLVSQGWRPSRNADAWKTLWASARDLTVMVGIGVALLFVVCPRAMRAILLQIHHNSDGHGEVFLLGQWRQGGFWYYFPAALLIKLSLPYVAFVFGAAAAQPRRWLNGATWAALGLLLLTPTFRVQIGVRFVLPLVVLALCGSAAAAAAWWAAQTSKARQAFGCVAFLGLLAWSAVNAWQVWPHGICYTNEIFGGTKEGYRSLIDSNYDWGQGLKELAAWQKRHQDVPVNVCYFGWHTTPIVSPMRKISPDVLANPRESAEVNQGCYLAVSTHYLCATGPLAKTLAAMTPCDRTMTYFIYDFTDRDWSRLLSSR